MPSRRHAIGLQLLLQGAAADDYSIQSQLNYLIFDKFYSRDPAEMTVFVSMEDLIYIHTISRAGLWIEASSIHHTEDHRMYFSKRYYVFIY